MRFWIWTPQPFTSPTRETESDNFYKLSTNWESNKHAFFTLWLTRSAGVWKQPGFKHVFRSLFPHFSLKPHCFSWVQMNAFAERLFMQPRVASACFTFRPRKATVFMNKIQQPPERQNKKVCIHSLLLVTLIVLSRFSHTLTKVWTLKEQCEHFGREHTCRCCWWHFLLSILTLRHISSAPKSRIPLMLNHFMHIGQQTCETLKSNCLNHLQRFWEGLNVSVWCNSYSSQV